MDCRNIIKFIIYIFILFLLNCSHKDVAQEIKLISFTTHQSRQFHFSEMENKNFILYFGFSHCIDKCPQAISNLSKVLNEIGNKSIYGIFVSLDPIRDDPNKINGYIKLHPATNLIGVTGSSDSIVKLSQFFGIQSQKIDFKDGNYLLDHTNQIILIDKKFQIIARFPGNISSEALKNEVNSLFK